MELPNLFALLVAINEYQPPVPPLHGCVNDLEKVDRYLNSLTDRFEPHIHILRNSEATKGAVINGFKNHLSAAGERDVVFFYFSGHGTQEEADPLFWPSEPDRKLEALVCYDSYVKQNGNVRYQLMADKELRYLIYQVAQNGPHILSVFDCCHSGGNTRNGYISNKQTAIERRLVSRERLSQAFPARVWEDFIFSEEISKEQAQNLSLSQWLPEGKHIQMAACQDDQSAFEVKGEGVFTKNLIDIITRCQGEITYFDLQSRIQNYIKNQFDQKPRIYTSEAHESDLFLGFLNGQSGSKPNYGNINFNHSQGWIMDLGAMQGIPPQSETVHVESLDGRHRFHGTLDEVNPNYSILAFDPAVLAQLDKDADYKGYITKYLSWPIGLFVDPELTKNNADKILGRLNNLNSVAERHQADYCLEIKDNKTIISRPQMPGIPLVPAQSIESDNDLSILSNYLTHITQFEFIKNLHNPNTFLFNREPVELSIYKLTDDDNEQPVANQNGTINLGYYHMNNPDAGEKVKIKIRNRSDGKLYVALLYLSMNFGVKTKLIPEVVHSLEPNKEVWAFDGKAIGLKMEPEITEFNYSSSTSFLKLLICTEDFKDQVTRFELQDLPSPSIGWRGVKGLAVDSYNPGAIQDWTTRLYTLIIANPDFQE